MPRADIDFVINLRKQTAALEFRKKLRPPGYLVAPAYLTGPLTQQAVELSAAGQLMIADNGLFDDIARLEKSIVSRNDFKALAKRAAALAATVDARQHLSDQLAVSPTAMIGIEDITAALWHRLRLNADTVPGQRAALRRRNRSTAKKAKRFASDAPPHCEYLPVAAAQDYDTAFDAGREFAAAGFEGAALGFGAFMSDDSTTQSVVIRGVRRSLPRSMPYRYLGTALVARGFWDGWRKESNSAPKRFHFLGLGAPIMLGVVSCAAAATPSLTFDATSPIKDSVEATLYVSRPSYLKIRTWKAAERLLDEGGTWKCPCPFCKSFIDTYPFDYRGASAWYRKQQDKNIKPQALRSGGPLYDRFPLLAQPSGSPLGRAIDVARIGHNHWALKQATQELAAARRKLRLETHVDKIVTAYERATPLRDYAAAVRLSYDIARGAWP